MTKKRGSHYYRMADMKNKNSKTQLSEKEIDNFVISQADDDAAWEDPVNVKMSGETIALPSELAARAAFIARLHHEKSVVDWLKRIIKERIELEEAAFSGLKRELASRRSRG